MMFQLLVVPASALTIEVTGNGVESDNDVIVKTEQTTSVEQSNNSNVTNNINATASTGNNSASRNTGGDVNVSTGNATSEVNVTNALGSNEAVVDCCSAASDVNVVIGGTAGNGDSTDNTINLTNKNNISLGQTNVSNVTNKVNNDASSGWNSADRNSGGSVTVSTGNASATTLVSTGGNVNSAVVSGGGASGGVSAMIVGNGVKSDNDIVLGLYHGVEVGQYNSARVRNFVDTDAVTGKNSASRNTGGDVMVDTGDATVEVLVDNAVNFNYADVDCGCLFDVHAKISKNGDSSDNTIKATLEDGLAVGQENTCKTYHPYMPRILSMFMNKHVNSNDCLTNDVYADAYSGWNNADRNTGGYDTDPSVDTGNAMTTVDVINAGNSNVFGEMADWEIPTGGNSVNVNISFDLYSLLGMLGLIS